MKKIDFWRLLVDNRLIRSVLGQKRYNQLVAGRVQKRIDTKIRTALNGWIKSEGFRDKNSTVDDIAESLGVGSAQLNYFCRNNYSCSFSVLRTRLRIEEAKKLLLNCPEMTASSIGEWVGIGDRSNFRKLFEQLNGCTPREWREIHLKELKSKDR